MPVYGRTEWGRSTFGGFTGNPVQVDPLGTRRILTDRAWDFLNMIPPWAQADPQIRAAILAMSNECDRIDHAIADVTAMYFPQLAVRYLYLWEASLGLKVNPVGLTVIQRQQRVLAFLQTYINTVPGYTWVNNLTALLGPSWSWIRHTPGALGGVPANTIQINLPFAITSPQAVDLLTLIELITPANIQITFSFGHGFIVQQSEIQVQPL